jgi:hypothetical protein
MLYNRLLIGIAVGVAIGMFAVYFGLGGYKFDNWIADALLAFGMYIIGFVSKVVKDKSKKLLHDYNNNHYVQIINRRSDTVYLYWGDGKSDSFGYGEEIPLEPNHAVCRKVLTKTRTITKEQPCVIISCQKNGMTNALNTFQNVGIIWDFNQKQVRKVFEVGNDGVRERDPKEELRWINGSTDIYQN